MKRPVNFGTFFLYLYHMKKAAALLLVLIWVDTQLYAQEFPKNETNNIRIDPFQFTTIDASEFCWAYDMVYDKKGNTISAGYLRGYLTDTAVHLTSDECGSFCSDKLYLAKQTRDGKREWVNSAIGNVRPTGVRINKKGEICLAGSFYGKRPIFLGTHQTQATDSSAAMIDQGFFITKYKSTGEIIACKIISGKELFAFELDDKGNFYLGGCDEFRTSKDKSYSRRKLKLIRINSDFTSNFTFTGDTLGDSHISSISIQKNILAAMLVYSDTCITPFFTLKNNYEQHGALCYLNTDGKFIRVQSEVNGQLINPGIALLDDDQSIYLATGGYNHPQHLIKLNGAGYVIWQEMITKPSMNTITKLLIHENNLLFCGYGYGALFGANSTMQYAYKAKISTDFFICSYTKNGQVNWLKAGGDQGTEYCQSIAIYKDELAAFGFVPYGGKFTFNEQSFSTRNSLWLAKFKLNSLAHMNIWEPNPIKLETPKFVVNETNCSCTIKADGNEDKFMQSASSFIDDAPLEKYIGWKLDSGYQLDRNAYLFNFYAQPSHGEGFYTFKLYTFKPLKLVHPNNLFTLNLTPCVAEANINGVPISIGVSYGIRKYHPGFEVEKFDSSVFAIYDILQTVNNRSTEDILLRAIDEGDGYFDYNKWITHINTTYHLTVPKKFTDLYQLANKVIQQLDARKIDLDTFMVKEFVKTGKHTAKIKPEEWQKLCDLFEYNFERDLPYFYRFLFPSVNASSTSPFIAYELSTRAISAWNDILHAPDTLNSQIKPSRILAQSSEFRLTSDGKSEISVTKWYHNKSVIMGTQARFKIKEAMYIGNEQNSQQVFGADFLQLCKDTTVKQQVGYIEGFRFENIKYINEVASYQGLLVKDGTMWMEKDSTVIRGNINHLILNNQIIAGTISFPLTVLDNGNWLIGTEQAHFNLKPNDAESTFRNIGFNNVLIKNNGNTLSVSFLKLPKHE